jgi:hypothetical protein
MLYLEDYLESECAVRAVPPVGPAGGREREWTGRRDGKREGEAGDVSFSR